MDNATIIEALTQAKAEYDLKSLQLSSTMSELCECAESMLDELAEYEETHTPYQYNACLRAVGITKKDIAKLHKLVGDTNK